MTPADFTIEFYRKCLSQAKWISDEARDIESISMLRGVALERGGDFLAAYDAAHAEAYSQENYKLWYNKTFPVASQEATETQNTKPNTTTTMNTLLKDIYEVLIKPLVDAIDRNTAAKGGCSAPVLEPATTSAEPEDKPEPKKRGPKAKAYVETGVNTPEPENLNEKLKPLTVVEPEVVVEEEPYMTGPELVELMKPLKDTPYTKKLVEFRDNTLGFSKMTREMSDPVMLRQMEAKIREFLAANEEDQKDAA